MVLRHLTTGSYSLIRWLTCLCLSFYLFIVPFNSYAAETSSDDDLNAEYQAVKDYLMIGGPENLMLAKDILDRLLAKLPASPPLLVEMARYHLKSGEEGGVEQAEQRLARALRLAPNSAEAHLLLGYVFTLQGRFDEAQVKYEQAEVLGTDNLWLYANWGTNDLLQQQMGGALEKYLKAVETESQNATTRYVRRWIYGGSDFFNLLVAGNDVETAERHYDRYAELNPAEPCIVRDKGRMLLYYTSALDRAIESFSRAAELGCQGKSAEASLAYFLRWHQGLGAGVPFNDLKRDYLIAEQFAPNDAQLLYGAAQSSITSVLLPALLHEGKEINSINSEGMTALLYSIAAQDVRAAFVLLKHGASPRQQLANGLTALDIARYNGQQAFVELLQRF